MDSLGLLDEDAFAGRGLEVLGEDSSALSDDGGCFVVLEDLLLELFGFLGSRLVEGGDVGVVLGDLSLFLFFDASEDFSPGVELSLELGFELDSLCVALSDVLVVGSDIVIASLLESLVLSVILLLFVMVSVL